MGQPDLLFKGPIGAFTGGSSDAFGADGRRLVSRSPSGDRRVEPASGHRVERTETHVGRLGHDGKAGLRPLPERIIWSSRPPDVPNSMLALEKCAPQSTRRREIVSEFRMSEVYCKEAGGSRKNGIRKSRGIGTNSLRRGAAGSILESGGSSAQPLQTDQLRS